MERPWYSDVYRRGVVDMHITDFDERILSEFDPKTYVDMLRRAGCQSVVLFAHSHVGLCYFPTKVGGCIRDSGSQPRRRSHRPLAGEPDRGRSLCEPDLRHLGLSESSRLENHWAERRARGRAKPIRRLLPQFALSSMGGFAGRRNLREL